jgi:hypothetical protein
MKCCKTAGAIDPGEQLEDTQPYDAKPYFAIFLSTTEVEPGFNKKRQKMSIKHDRFWVQEVREPCLTFSKSERCTKKDI